MKDLVRQKQDLLSQFRILHALCSASNLWARDKRRKTSVQADSQHHVLHHHELMSHVWPVNSNRILFLNWCEQRIPCQRNTGTWLATALRRRPRAKKEMEDVCTQATKSRIETSLTKRYTPKEGLDVDDITAADTELIGSILADGGLTHAIRKYVQWICQKAKTWQQSQSGPILGWCCKLWNTTPGLRGRTEALKDQPNKNRRTTWPTWPDRRSHLRAWEWRRQ